MAGVFVCDSFSSVFAFKRDLGPVGCIWFVETSRDRSVLGYAMGIVKLSGLWGSAIIQARNNLDGIKLLDIKPRFSSFVAARAVCGFRDAERSVELALGRSPQKPKGPFKHIRFRRYFHELLDFGEGFNALSEWDPRDTSISD